jgi:hypothetical protein
MLIDRILDYRILLLWTLWSIDSSFLMNLVANDRYGFLTQPNPTQPAKIQKFLTQPTTMLICYNYVPR